MRIEKLFFFSFWYRESSTVKDSLYISLFFPFSHTFSSLCRFVQNHTSNKKVICTDGNRVVICCGNTKKKKTTIIFSLFSSCRTSSTLADINNKNTPLTFTWTKEENKNIKKTGKKLFSRLLVWWTKTCIGSALTIETYLV